MPANVSRTGNNLPNGNFLPAVWSKKLNNKYYAQVCLMDITNNDWQGEIVGQGSQVEIRSRPTVQTFDMSENQKIQYQDVTDDKQTLLLDKARGFAVKVGDIDQAQSDIKILNELTTDAGFQMKIAVEKQVFSTVYSDATNSITSLTLDKTNIIDWIIDAEVLLQQNNIPDDGRWIVLPPKAGGLIQKSDLKNAAITGDPQSIMRKNMNNGRLGQIGGMTVYISNNLTSSGTTFQCIAGHKSAITFASQIVKVENVRLQDYYGDAVRGLNVYGYKTVIPGGLVSMPAVIS